MYGGYINREFRKKCVGVRVVNRRSVVISLYICIRSKCGWVRKIYFLFCEIENSNKGEVMGFFNRFFKKVEKVNE